MTDKDPDIFVTKILESIDSAISWVLHKLSEAGVPFPIGLYQVLMFVLFAVLAVALLILARRSDRPLWRLLLPIFAVVFLFGALAILIHWGDLLLNKEGTIMGSIDVEDCSLDIEFVNIYGKNLNSRINNDIDPYGTFVAKFDRLVVKPDRLVATCCESKLEINLQRADINGEPLSISCGWSRNE